MSILRFIPFLAALAWGVRRMRGSEMRKHGGWQMWLPALAVWAAVGLLLLTGCDSIGDPFERRSNAGTSSNTTQQQAQSAGSAAQTGGGKSAADAEWDRILQYPGPTAVHYPAQCPGASNAEIDAALQSNEPMTCGSGQ